MDATVYVNKATLDYARRKARNCPHEIHAYLIGEVLYPNRIIISSIEHAREYESQTKYSVQPTAAEFSRVAKIAEDKGKRIIGDVHSHPDYEAIMSPDDHRACVEDGLQICGIISIRERRTSVRFWLVNSALPCAIKYL